MKCFISTAQMLPKLLCLFLLLVLSSSLSAQIKLSVQGLVKKSDGTALPDGNYDLTFRFYDAENGGAALASELVTTEINGGVYSAILGSGGGLDMLPFDKPYYVSVAVDGGTELLPRIAMSAAPYAISLQGANNKFPSTGTVKADALQVAGAATVGGALSVTGTATLSGVANTNVLYANGRIHSNNGFAYHNNGTGNNTGLFFNNSARAGIYTNANDRLLAWDDNKNYYRASAGHVFDVGNVTVNGSITGSSGVITGTSFQYSNGQGVFFDGGGGTDLSLRLAGGGDRILIGNNGVTYYNASAAQILQVGGNSVLELRTPYGTNTSNENDWGNTSVIIRGLQRGPDKRNVQWDEANGRLFFDSSSKRYKSNIGPLVDDFTKILEVQPKTYDRPGSEGYWEVGYIAEEIDSLGLKHLVEYSKGIPDGVNYEKMVLYVIEVAKMQQTAIAQLKAEVAALKAETSAVRTENTGLRADNTALQTQQADFGKQLEILSKRLKSLENAASNR